MSTSCNTSLWLPTIVDSIKPTLIVSIIAIIIHGIFWIQFVSCSSLRKRNMMWLYAYLITDFILMSRFFILYGIRLADICLSTTSQNILCYFEASSKFYVNTVQSYLLLAFNFCRYVKIVSGRNIFTEKPCLIILMHLLIYILPAINVIVQFVTNLAQIVSKLGESCDIRYASPIVQVFNIFVIYIIPVLLGLILLGLGIHHVSSVRGVVSQQIINLRRKRQRTLLFQTIAFYTIWLVLWSPDILASQFTDVNSGPAIFTALLSDIETALDPAIIAMLDVRFLTAWRTAWNKMKRHRHTQIVPIVATIPRLTYLH